MNKISIYLLLGMGVMILIISALYINGRGSKEKISTISEEKKIASSENIFSDISNMCELFPKEMISTMLGVGDIVIKTDSKNSTNSYYCQYIVKDNNFVSLSYNRMNVEKQKKGLIVLERKVITDKDIPMDNFIAMNDKDNIIDVYLVMDPNEYVRVSRGSVNFPSSNENMIIFARSIAEIIVSGQFIYKNEAKISNTSAPISNNNTVITNFFKRISEGSISEAVGMMSPETIVDDSTKQAWGVQLNSFKSIELLSVDPIMEEEWTNIKEEYKVVINAKMKPESASAPIPYYGWNDGSNTRFITLEKKGNEWYIQGIGTGP